MQERIASIRPFPVGVVFIQDPRRHATIGEIQAEFKTIASVGFTALKQVMLLNTSTPFVKQVFNAALDEGLVPWWYGLGGWEAITSQLLAKLGIAANCSLEDAEKDPRMLAYQDSVLRARVARIGSFDPNPPPNPQLPSAPGLTVLPLADNLVSGFATWLEGAYDHEISALWTAWHFDTVMSVPGNSDTLPQNFTEAAMLLVAPPAPTDGWARMYEASSFAFTPWQQAAGSRDWARFRDVFRFQAGRKAAVEAYNAQYLSANDPGAPVRVGGETMMLDNQAQNGWDRSLMAAVAREYGGFYDSMHFPWHYELANAPRTGSASAQQAPWYRFNPTAPLYLMAKEIADGARGQWAGTFESTGGPAQLSGFQPAAVTAGMMRRMLLGYAAAGLKGVGLWCWNARFHGQEGGEYALTTLQGRPGSRAVAAGAVARAFQRWRFELWEAQQQPVVAVLYSWENEALYARAGFAGGPVIACAVSGCKDFRSQLPYYAVKARAGAAAALTAAGVPWEWVTEEEAAGWGAEGLRQRGFRALVCPGLLGANASSLVPVLGAFAQAGGRVVADAPFLLYAAPHADLLDHTDPVAPGQPSVADLFGVYTENLQNSANGFGHTVRLPAGGQAEVNGIYEEVAVAGGASVDLTVEEASGQEDQLPFTSATAAAVGSGGGSAVRVTFELFKLAFAETSSSAEAVPLGPMQGTGSLSKLAVWLVTDAYKLVSGSSALGWTVADEGVPPPESGWPLVPADGQVYAFKRSSPAADHFFVLNERSTNATLVLTSTATAAPYSAAAINAVTMQSQECSGVGSTVLTCTLNVPAKDAIWLRLPR